VTTLRGQVPSKSHVSITLDTYSHAAPALQDEAAALIAGLVFAGA
jgi:hypothetical protein